MCFLIFVVSVYSTSLHGSRMFSIVFIWKGASNTFKNNVSGFWLAIAKGFFQASLVHLGFHLLLSSEQLLGDLLLLLLRSLLFSLPHHLFEHRPGSAWLPWTNVCVHLALGKCLQDHFLLGVREFVWLKVFFKVDGQLSPWNLRVLLHGGLNGFQAPSWFRLMLKLQLTHQPVRPCHLREHRQTIPTTLTTLRRHQVAAVTKQAHAGSCSNRLEMRDDKHNLGPWSQSPSISYLPQFASIFSLDQSFLTFHDVFMKPMGSLCYVYFVQYTMSIYNII